MAGRSASTAARIAISCIDGLWRRALVSTHAGRLLTPQQACSHMSRDAAFSLRRLDFRLVAWPGGGAGAAAGAPKLLTFLGVWAMRGREDQCKRGSMSFLGELWRFMRTRKKFWLLPI